MQISCSFGQLFDIIITKLVSFGNTGDLHGTVNENILGKRALQYLYIKRNSNNIIFQAGDVNFVQMNE